MQQYIKEMFGRGGMCPHLSVSSQLNSQQRFTSLSLNVWVSLSPLFFSGAALPTSARVHGHAGVNLQHHVPVGVQEENAEGAHLLWDAARLRDAGDDSHSSDDALDGGMIRWSDHLGNRRQQK